MNLRPLHRALFLGSLTLGLAVGCDDGAPPQSDAGPEVDAGPTADAGPLADAGPGDAGAPDAGPGIGPHSSVTLFLRTGPLTFDAVDESGAGVIVDAGFADEMGALFFASGDTLYRLDNASRELVDPTPLHNNDRSGQISPDLMFSGVINGTMFILATAGTDAFVWEREPEDMMAPRFSTAVPLQQADGPMATPTPFMPPALGFISLDNMGFFPAAISEDNASFMIETTFASFTYIPVPGGIGLCNAGAPLTPEFITQGIVPGAPAAAAPTLLLIDDDRVYGRRDGGLCFDDGVQLIDESSSVIDAPTLAFAANFDASSDLSNEVLVVAETIE